MKEASHWEKVADVEVATKAVLAGSVHSAEAPHPITVVPGELFPSIYSRSYAGFLLREENREVKVNQDIVKHEMEYLAEFAVIGYFIDGCLPDHEMQAWISQL